MNDIRLKISPPWITYLNKIIALFDCDPEIAVNYSNENHKIVISTNNGEKGAALRRLLPEEVNFGNIKLVIEIDSPVVNIAFPTNDLLFNAAFDRSPALAYTRSIENMFGKFTYVVFKNYVVQFFNDNLNDIHGIVSTLYQDIAAELFADAGLYSVSYCTDVEHKVGMPLGEWP